MKIGIDARLWDQGGVGRYVRNLILNILQLDDVNNYVLFVMKGDEVSVKNQISKLKIKNEKLKIVTTNIKWHSISEQLRFSPLIKKEKVDLMHFTYQQSVPAMFGDPYVVTVHDLIRHHFVSGKSSTNPLWLQGFKMIGYRVSINMAAKKSKKIIAVSEFTKRDIVNNLGVSKDKIEVIYEAADDLKPSGVKVDIDNYFLFVGNVYYHKNAAILIEAFRILRKENPELKLVFVGKEDFFYKNLKNRLEEFVKEKSVLFLFDVADEKLSALYKNAICLVRPSLMEGFSLPPLEAISTGGLVLASDIAVHREVFGDCVFYFDPYRLDDILSKMKHVLALSKEDREKMIKKGEEKSKEYSWKKTAQQTLEVYESSLGL